MDFSFKETFFIYGYLYILAYVFFICNSYVTYLRHTRIRYRRKGWPAGGQIGKVISLDFKEVKKIQQREVGKKMSNKDNVKELQNERTIDDNKVIISREDFEYLKKRSWFLNQLEKGGVDNWSGYDYAYESLEDRILYEDLDAYNLISHNKYKDVERL